MTTPNLPSQDKFQPARQFTFEERRTLADLLAKSGLVDWNQWKSFLNAIGAPRNMINYTGQGVFLLAMDIVTILHESENYYSLLRACYEISKQPISKTDLIQAQALIKIIYQEEKKDPSGESSPANGGRRKPEQFQPSPQAKRIDFLLVTALPEELQALLVQLPGYRRLPPGEDDIRTYYQAEVPVTFSDGSNGAYRVMVMTLLGMGRVQAVTATADGIRKWKPGCIILVGIAGGIAARGVHLGDILVADQIVDYEIQKLTPQGPQIRWEIQRADARLLNACINFGDESWRKQIKTRRPERGTPIRLVGPIASGDKVIAWKKALAQYENVWPKLLGVEMEAGGVATAVFQSADHPGFFMVRCVSDLADAGKDTDEVKKWRPYACRAAAAYTVAFLQSGPVPC